MASEERVPWKKVLYGNKGYPDNYTDPSFLKELQKNKNVKIFEFTEAFLGITKLNYQLSTVTAFLLIFHAMYNEHIEPNVVLIYSSMATLLGYILYIRKEFSLRAFSDHIKTVLSVIVFGYISSPLLHTLTQSISTDTIFTMTFFVMFIHLIFFDYGVPAFMVSTAISFNAAIFGAICLSSRLSSSFHAFTLLIVSSEFFALLPLFMERFWSPLWMLMIAILSSYFLLNLSLSLWLTYILISFFVNIICPYVFVDQQKHKNNIHGPWDEAIVKEDMEPF
ncbi:phosphatidylinositol N-acetylglucosaminyltransferase subunit C [Bradysia coprophila]|uniref:phosphatidylinositol N-acetylglucosaminyltransferase subunit C n=1 Tax=Bradysia coprophila TaxID=38358 RepID=UPI00187D7958|nr:phosphatidylinositol N-acetylglucosaminyltransferase subunit C [Bradysia coprophila]